MKNLFMAIAIGILSIYSANAQAVKATTEAGIEVLLKADGTWETVKKKTDVICPEIIAAGKKEGSYSAIDPFVITNFFGKKAKFYLIGQDSTVMMSVSVEGSDDCLGKHLLSTDHVSISFKDGTSLTLEYNKSENNCDGLLYFFLGKLFKNEDALTQLTTKTVKSFIFFAPGYGVIQFATISDKEATMFKKIMSCLKDNSYR